MQYEVAQFDLQYSLEKNLDFTDCGDNFLYYEFGFEGELMRNKLSIISYKFKPKEDRYTNSKEDPLFQ